MHMQIHKPSLQCTRAKIRRNTGSFNANFESLPHWFVVFICVQTSFKLFRFDSKILSPAVHSLYGAINSQTKIFKWNCNNTAHIYSRNYNVQYLKPTSLATFIVLHYNKLLMSMPRVALLKFQPIYEPMFWT